MPPPGEWFEIQFNFSSSERGIDSYLCYENQSCYFIVRGLNRTEFGLDYIEFNAETGGNVAYFDNFWVSNTDKRPQGPFSFLSFSPSNGGIVGRSNNISFSIDDFSENCTIWENFSGVWRPNKSISPAFDSVNYSFSLEEVELGSYNWGIACFNGLGFEFSDNRTFVLVDDIDQDLVLDPFDNCPTVSNPNQSDIDADLSGDSCDNCLNVSNALQTDIDIDGLGNLCDNCPGIFNPNQTDTNNDDIGDSCTGTPMDNGLITLSSGWNLVGFPFTTKNLPDVMVSLSGCFDHLATFNSGNWYMHNPLLNDSINTLKNLTFGLGYWIRINCSSATWNR